MEIKEINEVLEQAIADLANKDDMEAEDGMNIVEENEVTFVGDEVAELAKGAIEKINGILEYVDDEIVREQLETALIALKNLVPELQ